MTYHLTPIRMPKMEKKEITSVGKDVEKKGILVHCWRECKLV